MKKDVRVPFPTDPHYGFFRITELPHEWQLEQIAGKPQWKGVRMSFKWRDYDNGNGIEVDRLLPSLDLVHSYGLVAYIRLLYIRWDCGGPDAMPLCPPWYFHDTSLPQCNITDKYGLYYGAADDIGPMVWHPDAAEPLIVAHEQTVAGLKDHPAYYGMSTEETTIARPASGGDCGFDVDALEAYNKNLMSRIKAADPDHIAIAWPNFVPWDQTRISYLEWLRDNGITIGCPDIVIKTDGDMDTLYDFMKDNRDAVCTFPEIQWPDVDWYNQIDGGKCTPEELLRFAKDNCDPWHICVTDREPHLTNQDGTLDSNYAEWKHPVKSFMEATQALTDEGWDLGHDPITPPQNPVVSVVVSGSPVNDNSGATAKFTLSCPECSGESIAFTIGGSAVEGTHFTIDKASPQPAGTEITITPINFDEPGDSVMVTLTINPGAGYDIGNGSGSIQINNVQDTPTEPHEIKVTVNGTIAVDVSGSIEVT